MAKLARRRKLQKQKERAVKIALREKLNKIKRQIESKRSIEILKRISFNMHFLKTRYLKTIEASGKISPKAIPL
jgi:hypothetical protein